jgi:hypothetical protein
MNETLHVATMIDCQDQPKTVLIAPSESICEVIHQLPMIFVCWKKLYCIVVMIEL